MAANLELLHTTLTSLKEITDNCYSPETSSLVGGMQLLLERIEEQARQEQFCFAPDAQERAG